MLYNRERSLMNKQENNKSDIHDSGGTRKRQQQKEKKPIDEELYAEMVNLRQSANKYSTATLTSHELESRKRDGQLLNDVRKRPKKKKKHAQVFLYKMSAIENMIKRVTVNENISVLEIGGGNGTLTQAILDQTKGVFKKLICFEIDPEWAEFLRNRFVGMPKIHIRQDDVLNQEVDHFQELHNDRPLVLLANLPYSLAHMMLFKVIEHKQIFTEGVFLVQEEVAQRLVAKSGKLFNATSVYFQYNFHLELMEMIEPQAFRPIPKVNSRLVYFKPKSTSLNLVEDEVGFWKFVRNCFRQPRKTLRNNLQYYDYSQEITLKDDLERFLNKRPQEMTFQQFVSAWEKFQFQYKQDAIELSDIDDNENAQDGE